MYKQCVSQHLYTNVKLREGLLSSCYTCSFQIVYHNANIIIQNKCRIYILIQKARDLVKLIRGPVLLQRNQN